MLSLVPKEIEEYAERHTSPEPPLFQALAAETQTKTELPQMQVGLVEGMFLKLLVRAMGARRVLEVGTFTGYSALMMAEGTAEDGEVVTCEIDRGATDIARRHWEQSPHGRKITLEMGRAADTIAKLDGPFDAVFIDADKQNYINYYDAILPKVRTGGLIIADNVLWSGRVLDPQEPDDHALAAFNRHVIEDPRVEVVMLPIRDGITLACKL